MRLEWLRDPLRRLLLLLADLVELLLELRDVALAAFLLALFGCRHVELSTRRSILLIARVWRNW